MCTLWQTSGYTSTLLGREKRMSKMLAYVYSLVFRPQYSGVQYMLMTTFPNKELTEDTATVSSAGLVGAAVLQRLKWSCDICRVGKINMFLITELFECLNVWMPYPRVRIKSVAQGCKNLPPVAGLKKSLSWAWAQARLHPFICQFESDLMCFWNTIYSSEK